MDDRTGSRVRPLTGVDDRSAPRRLDPPPPPRPTAGRWSTVLIVGALLVGGVAGFVIGVAGPGAGDAAPETTTATPASGESDGLIPTEQLTGPTTATREVRATTDVTPLALRIPALAGRFIAGTTDVDGRRRAFVWPATLDKARFTSLRGDEAATPSPDGSQIASWGPEGSGMGHTLLLHGGGPTTLLGSSASPPVWHPNRPHLSWVEVSAVDDGALRLVRANWVDSSPQISTRVQPEWPAEALAAEVVAWGDWGWLLRALVEDDSGVISERFLRVGEDGATITIDREFLAADPTTGRLLFEGEAVSSLRANAAPPSGDPRAPGLDPEGPIAAGGGRFAGRPADGPADVVRVVDDDGARDFALPDAVTGPMAVSPDGAVVAAVAGDAILVLDLADGSIAAIEPPGPVQSLHLGVLE